MVITLNLHTRLKTRQNRRAFTLAELMIVMAIIAVLVGISIPIFMGQLEKSKEATDIANMRAAIRKKTEKIAKWQEQKRIMEEKLEKRENTAILGIVREIGMTPEELETHFADLLPKKEPKIKKEVKPDEPDPT